ncbi:N-acetylneuraminate epimerase, partial [Escherichia coli]|nr:N-acetylneuraminate epimerase [Escherichia coli]EEZ7963126.1 N-acetylneuraminate epimerase [Escherichia coli]EFA0250998.1 N-acetylneuraminate epimerase [Escherichia coli]EFD6038334.1 N-acetylneuraminate epimerase [Escherichia coli]
QKICEHDCNYFTAWDINGFQ